MSSEQITVRWDVLDAGASQRTIALGVKESPSVGVQCERERRSFFAAGRLRARAS